jgi:two-component system phosphate regulon response regulator PhoB
MQDGVARILLVQGDSDARRAIVARLERAPSRHVVVPVTTMSEALACARDRRHDIVVLDVSTVKRDALTLCRALRAQRTMHEARIIAIGEEADDPAALVASEDGADVALVEPYALATLERALVVAPRGEGDPFESNVLRIDRSARRVFVEGEEIDLTRLELELLLFLAGHPERVQSRETLLTEVWKMDSGVDTRTIDTHVRRLRGKLGSARAHVASVRRSGYKFTATPGEPSRAT